MLKCVLFGTGQYYAKNILLINKYVKVIALLDNDINKIGRSIDGINVYSPDSIDNIEYDIILLMAMGTAARQMYAQLVSKGVDSKKIRFLDEFYKEYCYDVYEVHSGKKEIKEIKESGKKKVAIIDITLNYRGGSTAIYYMARLLMLDGKEVSIIVSDMDPKLVEEVTNDGIDVVVCPAITNARDEVIKKIDSFDFYVFNTAFMIDTVLRYKWDNKAIWWIHEADEVWRNVLDRYPEYKSATINGIDVFAVSDLAKKNFNKYYPNTECGILHYALPDYTVRDGLKKTFIRRDNEKIVFALVGGIIPLKAQKEFLLAAKSVEKDYPNTMEIWLIGKNYGTPYSRDVLSLINGMTNVKYMGEKTQKEIRELYRKIDVLVCPSYEDSLPIVVTEGFMNSKTCIVSDNTGTALIMHDKEDGLVCKAGESESIADCMKWCINHKDSLEEIGDKARLIYEGFFTEQILLERLKRIMDVKK